METEIEKLIDKYEKESKRLLDVCSDKPCNAGWGVLMGTAQTLDEVVSDLKKLQSK